MEKNSHTRITPLFIEYTNMKFWWLYLVRFLTPGLIYLEIIKGGIKFSHSKIFDVLSIIYVLILVPLLAINLYFSFVLNIDIENQLFKYIYTFWIFLAVAFILIIPSIVLSRNINIRLEDILEYGPIENLEKSRAFRFIVLFN
ncbi:MAG TPA: hypothetical protein VIK81_05270, partial [Patescibacteria group bacterium]